MASSLSWSTKLEKKLSVLTDTASRESIQTVAKWIGFNRKYAEAFGRTMVEAFRKASSSLQRQWLLMQVLHEVLLLELNTAKWERLNELRNVLGEHVLLAVLQQKIVDVSTSSSASWLEKFQAFLNQWEEKQVWEEGSTLLAQIRTAATALQVESKASEVVATTSSSPITVTTATTTATTTAATTTSTCILTPPTTTPEDFAVSVTVAAEINNDQKESVSVTTNQSDKLPVIPEAVQKVDNQQSSHDDDGEQAVMPTAMMEESQELITPSVADVATVEHKPTATMDTVEEEPIVPAINNDDEGVAEGAETVSSEKVEETDSTKPTTTDVAAEYDFDSKGIPFNPVEAREFLEPCKAIATLQIARDLRNDGFAQLSSLLSSIPEDIKEFGRQAKQHEADTGEPLEMDAERTRDYSLRLSDKFLDLDMEEQMQSIRTFRELVEKQRVERQKLILLLIQSRCQFGAKEAADAFFQLDETAQKLQKRKELISDAMALEGLDSEEVGVNNNKDEEGGEKELEPLTWYDELMSLDSSSSPNSSSKRAKTS